jgi:cyclophilin family peptidyl-prolyl cis-trans isomerase
VRRSVVLIAILLAALLLVACGKEDPRDAASQTATTQAAPAATATTTTATTATTATTTTATATTTTATTDPAIKPRSAKDGCQAVAVPEPKGEPDLRPSRRRLSAKRTYTAILRTNCGTIRIRLDVRHAPKTTASFAGLARRGFFDGLTFHRIAKPGGNDYVIQGGDPLGTGNGGPGYSVEEPPPFDTKYRRYVVGMAKAGDERPGTSGSQFFIVTAAEAPLPAEYALLGRVTGGKKVVRRIARLATDPATEMPLDPVVIRDVRVVTGG